MCKYYLVVIHNTYHGVNVETYHPIICLIPEDVAKHFAFPNFATPVSGTLKEVLYNYTTTRDNIYLNGLEIKKVESVDVSMILKKGMEVAQDHNVFNHVTPIPHKEVNPQYRTIVSGPGVKSAPKIVLPGNSKDKVGNIC